MSLLRGPTSPSKGKPVWLPLHGKDAGHPPEGAICASQEDPTSLLWWERKEMSLGAVPGRRRRARHTLGFLDPPPSPVPSR